MPTEWKYYRYHGTHSIEGMLFEMPFTWGEEPPLNQPIVVLHPLGRVVHHDATNPFKNPSRKFTLLWMHQADFEELSLELVAEHVRRRSNLCFD